jgi:hypothetical protein
MVWRGRLLGGVVRLVRPVAAGRTYMQAVDLVLDPFAGLAWSLVFGVLLLAGVALAPTVVGLAVLGEVVMIARAVLGVDRDRARVLLGVRHPTAVPCQAACEDAWFSGWVQAVASS